MPRFANDRQNTATSRRYAVDNAIAQQRLEGLTVPPESRLPI